MQGITEESFNTDFDEATDNKVLNVLLRERTAFLDKILDFCSRHDDHEKLLKHKQGKMTLFKKVLVRSDFVGEKAQKKLTLKKAVEGLYNDIGEEKGIKKFQENLLATWQRQWEEGKDTEESGEKLVARWRIISGILQRCQELEMKDLRKRLLNEMEEVASLIEGRKRKNAYRSALQVKKCSNDTSITVILMNLNP